MFFKHIEHSFNGANVSLEGLQAEIGLKQTIYFGTMLSYRQFI